VANLLHNLSFQKLFDIAADAMLLVDSSGHIVEANFAALQLLEYSEATICGLTVEALIPERFRGHHHQYRNGFFQNPEKRSMGDGRDLFALSSSGKELAVDIGLSPIKIQDQTYILITFYAADKRRETEQALRVSNERLELAKQAANLGVFDVDPQNLALHYDERILELWGKKPGETINYDEFIGVINPEDRVASAVEFNRCFDPAGDGKYYAEYRIKNPHDGVERWVSSVGEMHFKDGKAVRFVGVARDITKQKLTEKILQEQRIETESFYKQQIASHTASAIAHELNQPLAAISAYSEVALHELSHVNNHPEILIRALEGCVSQAQRAGTSLHELIAFLQVGELITERFDLNETVLDALNTTKGDGLIGLQPILQLDRNIPLVLGNKIQIQKVLVNLLRNAIEATNEKGQADSAIAVSVKIYTDKNMAHVSVEDRGHGISQELAERIFEPFFTTKSKGIGMGLLISRALIKANGGQLWLEQNASDGATFHFTLPFIPNHA